MNVIEYLNQNRMLNMPLIEGLERGEATLMHFDDDGAVIDLRGVITFCLTSDKALLKYEQLVKNNVCLIQNARSIEEIISLFPDAERRAPCYTLVYTKKEPPALSMPGVEFKLLDRSYAQFIFDTYLRRPNNIETIYQILDEKYMFGIFVDGEIAGYCGRHYEGSMGLLEILPKFKRRGLGTEIEKFIIGEVLKEGRTPYGHVEFGNDVSMSLQKKMDGLVFLPEIVMWHIYRRK